MAHSLFQLPKRSAALRLLAPVGAGLALLLTFTLILAASGDLDDGFGSGGVVLADFGSPYDTATALAFQPDGKIVVAAGGQTDFTVARYNDDGSLDSTFGASGIVTTDLGDIDGAASVAVQPDGTLVLAGTSGSNTAVVHYNSDGSLDTTFNDDGISVGDTAGRGMAAFQPDGKIVTLGSQGALARYNDDGSLDTTFGSDGRVTVQVDEASALALQPDGKIVVVGGADAGGGTGYDFKTLRYNSDGSLDTTFGDSGAVATDFGDSTTGDNKEDYARAVAIQLDGKIVVAGWRFDVDRYQFALVRYDADGSLDTGFGNGGKVTAPTGPFDDLIHAIAVQPDGKIVVAGRSASNVTAVRYTSDGSPDTSFGNSGRVTTTASSGVDTGRLVAVQPNGKIVVAGDIYSDTQSDLLLVRYQGAQVANNPPLAADDVVTTGVGSPVVISVLANDSDPDGDPLSVVAVGAPISGTATLSGTTAVSYTPAAGFTGSDVFTYTVSDGALTGTATVTVSVQATSTAPLPLVLAVESGSTNMELQWTVTNDPDVTHYRVLRAPGSGQTFQPIAETVTDTVYYDADATLVEGNPYCYRVEALHQDDSTSATSNDACALFGQLELWVPDTVGAPGETVIIPINVRNADGLRIAASDVWMEFDPRVLQSVSISRTSLTEAYAWAHSVQTIDDDTSRVRIAYIHGDLNQLPPELHGDGSLFWLTFQVPGQAGDTSPLDLKEFIQNVGGSSIQQEDLKDVELALDDGLFTVKGTGNASYILGDVDGDGVVRALDAALALRLANGERAPTAPERLAGDANGNGSIDEADASMILYYAGHGQWPPLPASVRSAEADAAHTASLRLDSVAGAPGATVQTILRGENLFRMAGGRFVLVYDPTVVERVLDVQQVGLAANFAQLQFHDAGNGLLSITLADGAEANGTGALLTLSLQLASDAAAGATPLRLAQAKLNDLNGRNFVTGYADHTLVRQSATITVEQRSTQMIYLPRVSR